MADSGNLPLLLVIAFAVFFSLTFILSTIGNIWVIVHCWKTLKRRKVSLMWFVLNLASADLLFTFLTFFNALAFLWRWIGGNITCKIQGFLVETAYTVSITNLVMISHQRSTSITDPLNARARNASNKDYRKIFILWVVGLAICSPLLFLYQVELDETGQAVCGNTGWGYTGKQIFYILHAIFLFVFPLCYMIYSQSKIFRALSSNRIVPSAFSATERSKRRHKKVAKTLLALTIVFVVCWSPFVVTRTLIYFHLAEPGMIWRASQLLICLNAMLDPIMYGYYGGNLKTALRYQCCQRVGLRQTGIGVFSHQSRPE